MRIFETKEEQEAEVERNVRAYRKAHRRYNRNHGEIFNEIEQTRLHTSLAAAVSEIRSPGRPLRALDVGCGSGNVTSHALDLDLHVVAADVSPEFLRTVSRRFDGAPLETIRLNGIDLSPIPDGAFDLVTAYSVLHHIPNYLEMVAEMYRVLRRGGVIYLDHEVNDRFWESGGCLQALGEEVRERAVSATDWWNPARRRWQRFLMPSKYVARARSAIDPDWWWKVEGDIHTWKEDHIEWHRIVDLLEGRGGQVVLCEDYLVFRAEYPADLYERYRETCSDMRVMAVRKAP